MLLLVAVIGILLFYQPATGQEFKQMNLAYGDDPKQTLDLYAPNVTNTLMHPVMIYVHGGGWMKGDKSNVADKPSFFTNKGYAFVSVNYRLFPHVVYHDMAFDVSSAVKWVYDHAEQYHIDKNRINLMGHSAGGHLVTLIGTKHDFLDQVGLSPETINSIVNLDGPIDLTEFIPRNEGYKPVFGDNRNGWVVASPITYAAQQLPPILLVGSKRNSTASFIKAARKAGNKVQTFESKRLTHREMTKLLGAENSSEEAINMTNTVWGFLQAYNEK